MKRIYVVFEDSEYKKLNQKKDGKTWHDFILELANGDEKK